MAVTITRTPWIDDDGTGTTGTVLNNALHTQQYNEIDAALAKVAQLTGGNTLTGNQTVAGVVSVSGFGVHAFTASGTGSNELRVVNTAAGAGNLAVVSVGNDTAANLLQLIACASNYTPNVYLQPNAGLILGAGAGGINIATSAATSIKFWTNYTERMRVLDTGHVLINTATDALSSQLAIVCNTSAGNGIGLQNLYTGNTGYLLALYNSASGLAGSITQVNATTVAFNTTSDARLKDDAGRATDVTALRAVVVHDFAWTADGRTDRGVFAQDTHAVFPRAVTVGTDETTDTGELAHPWMTDYSKFVPDLIVGWQQHDADLAEIRALLTTLKGFSDGE